MHRILDRAFLMSRLDGGQIWLFALIDLMSTRPLGKWLCLFTMTPVLGGRCSRLGLLYNRPWSTSRSRIPPGTAANWLCFARLTP